LLFSRKGKDEKTV